MTKFKRYTCYGTCVSYNIDFGGEFTHSGLVILSYFLVNRKLWQQQLAGCDLWRPLITCKNHNRGNDLSFIEWLCGRLITAGYYSNYIMLRVTLQHLIFQNRNNRLVNHDYHTSANKMTSILLMPVWLHFIHRIYFCYQWNFSKICFKVSNWQYVDGLVQQRRNSITNALELRLSCTYLSMSA